MNRVAPAVALCASLPITSVAQKTNDQMIAEAVSPLPESMRQGATVMVFTGTELERIRQGDNSMICLADDPGRTGFHVACYHEDLGPFMARGRELRAQGKDGNESRAMRFAEIEAGALEWPDKARSLYSLSNADDRGFDYEAGTIPGAWRLQVVYVPYATEQSTGISTSPARDRPWLMHPGTPGAHLMINIPPPQGNE
jgi:hypothetical protein